jgi:hypothetical protein
MSSRPLLILGIVGAVLAGVALFAVALAVVAIDGATLSGQGMATVVLGAMLGLVLDVTWLTFAVDRLSKLGGESDDEENDDGWGTPGRDPVRPSPPSKDLDWWAELDRDFPVVRDAREREPIADRGSERRA